jgi:hypothetical protein
MGSLGGVFAKWRRSLSNVHKQPSMQWSSGGAPVTTTTNFYIVGDLATATACYITAHGGANASDYYFDNETFTVPAGVTVNFYQPHGYVLGYDTCFLRNGPPAAHGGTDDQSFSGGSTCTNYILSKDQGRHLTGDADHARDMEMDYVGTQAVADELGIVMVTVRNRWFHAGVSLKSAVQEITRAAPGLTTINCLFCRSTETSGDDRWNAVDGTWDKA